LPRAASTLPSAATSSSSARPRAPSARVPERDETRARFEHRRDLAQPVHAQGRASGHEIDDHVGDPDVRCDLRGAGDGHDLHRLPARGEEVRRHAREHRRHAGAGPKRVDARDPTLLRRGNGEAAAAERQVREVVEVSSGLAHEVGSGDPGVRRAIGDELGDVLRAHEQRLELTAERGRQRAGAGGTNLEAGVGEQLAGFFRQPSFVGQCDSEHGGQAA
jgi:hypothetical protein